MTSVTGPRRLPPEILHMIVQHVSTQRQKQGYATCASVCRHWASIIRPYLFQRLRLRCAEDVTQLAAFLRSTPIMEEWIRQLTLIESPNTPAWFYHIHILPYLRVPVRLDYSGIDGGSFFTQAFPRPVLPRCHVYPVITHLELSDICFMRDVDLVRLVLSFPHLETFSFTGITFSYMTTGEPVGAITPRPSHPPLCYITGDECDDSIKRLFEDYALLVAAKTVPLSQNTLRLLSESVRNAHHDLCGFPGFWLEIVMLEGVRGK